MKFYLPWSLWLDLSKPLDVGVLRGSRRSPHTRGGTLECCCTGTRKLAVLQAVRQCIGYLNKQAHDGQPNSSNLG